MKDELNSRSARTAIFWRVHWWAALVATPFALLATLTGLLYVGTPQIEQSLYAHLEQVAPVQQALPLDQLVANAKAAAPEGMVLQQVVVGAVSHEALKVIFVPRVASADPHAHHHSAAQAASAAALASMASASGMDKADVAPRKPGGFGLSAGAVTLYLDSATGHVLGSLAQDSRFSQWAKHLHSRLLQGEGWRWMIELGASWMMVMLITGVALWWPQAGWPRRGRTGRAFWRAWHSCAGVALGLVSLVILSTGLTWSKYAGDEVRMLRDLAGQAPPQMPPGLRSNAPEGTAALSWQAALQAARAMAPAASLQLTPPRGADGIWRISMADRRQPTLRFEAAMDAYSGTALYTSGWAEQTAFGKATAIGIPFHRGEFGWWNQVVLAVFGLGVLFSLVSGWLMYFKRRKAGQLSLPRVPAGAWRALGAGWWTGALACLALMPLLLLSAPLVLLLDRLLERRKAAQASGAAG